LWFCHLCLRIARVSHRAYNNKGRPANTFDTVTSHGFYADGQRQTSPQ
jgi:hypothetical protein